MGLTSTCRSILGHPLISFVLYLAWALLIIGLVFWLQLFLGYWYSAWQHWNKEIEDQALALEHFCSYPEEIARKRSIADRCASMAADYRALVNDGPLLRSLESVFQRLALCGDMGCVRYFGNTATSLVTWTAIALLSGVAFVFLSLLVIRWFSSWSSMQRAQTIVLPFDGSRSYSGNVGYAQSRQYVDTDHGYFGPERLRITSKND